MVEKELSKTVVADKSAYSFDDSGKVDVVGVNHRRAGLQPGAVKDEIGVVIIQPDDNLGKHVVLHFPQFEKSL